MITPGKSPMPSRSITSARILNVSCLAIGLIVVTFAHAQTTTPAPIRTARARREPCWQQVGLSKEAIKQRRSIEQSTRSQVESVCADASLTPQQKHAKIKEIRQQARQQIDAIITPQQQEELRACNAEHGGNRPHPPRQGGVSMGPCGETSAATPAPSEGKAPPRDEPVPKQP